ncbi:hypothetical protein AU197_13460 [Mycobacterium sp. IS-1590]|uniref:PRC-barrel domain-containing protein n=1 Tax=Mycobacterium sp. IS-1590 TaxID=1772286 RepID=UPI000746AAAC|nr:PRC-barrel domain-containing protein [Mycobacterium sp. IS-1590]KUI45233.1 hypothetical protein AU197_13460 [Mycobacterium sp. IS-1590]
MRLSELLGLQVFDAGNHRVGTVIDVRLATSGDPTDDPPAPRVLGLVVSPKTRSSFWGFERSGATAPALIARIARWRHRGTFLAAWEDVARVGADGVRLQADYTRFSAMLPTAGV